MPKHNKLYFIIKDYDKINLSELKHSLKTLTDFKAVFNRSLDDKNMYFSLNLKEYFRYSDDALSPFIDKIKDVLLTYDLDINIYYRYNDDKKIIYKCKEYVDNKLYFIIKNINNYKENLKCSLELLKEFKGFYSRLMLDNAVYCSFNLKNDDKYSDDDLKPLILIINNLLIKNDINVNIYYKYDDDKKLIYNSNIS